MDAEAGGAEVSVCEAAAGHGGYVVVVVWWFGGLGGRWLVGL